MAPFGVICLYFIFLFKQIDSANILAVFPHVGKSHFFMFEPYVQQLALRGHHITLVSHFPPNENKNIRHISLAGSMGGVWFNAISLEEFNQYPSFIQRLGSVYLLNQIGQEVCKAGYEHKTVQEFLKQKPKIDLVIVEFFNTDCYAALSYYFNAPLIGIFSSYTMPWHNDRFGNPDNPAYIPNHFLQVSQHMNYVERLANTAATFLSKAMYRLFFDIPAHKIAETGLGIPLPPLHQIVSRSSLFLLNTHFTLFQPRPMVPGIVEVAGIHIEPPKKLPQDLQNYLDNSKNGVVYFSLGSTILGSSMGEEKRQIFAKVFSEIKSNFLWKWENGTFENKPDNVLLRKWLPQNEILAHPNVKVFVTHAGLMGTEESVYHGVPMLMVPLFGDQPVNAAAVSDKGVGITVDFTNLKEEELRNALNKLLDDNSYRTRAQRLSQVFKDRPQPIMDTAIYWTEYVIRYNGAPHMQSAVMKLSWYQEHLLDVIPVLLLIVILFIVLTIKMYISFFRTLFCRRKQQDLNKKLK